MDKNDILSKVELATQAGMQLIPVIGSPLASLYFGNKQEKRFKRIEIFYSELSNELSNIKEEIKNISEHNLQELSSILEDINNKIEDEYIAERVHLYKNYFKNTMVNPIHNNYSERKILLDIISQMTPLSIDIFNNIYLKRQIKSVDLVTEFNLDNALIYGSISQLKNLGIINARTTGLMLGEIPVGCNEILNISKWGIKFHEFCMEFNY